LGTELITPVATNSQGDATSAAAILIVNPAPSAPSFTTQPQNTTVTAGANATFTIAATGYPAPNYQWQSAPAGSDTWSDIPDATSATLTLDAVTFAMNGMRYRCVVTNSQGDATSDAVTLTVNAPPAITTQPQNTSATTGANATFTVAATGNPAPAYQWQSAPNASDTWTDIPGATSATLTLNSVTLAMNGTQYRCVATNSEGHATSDAATLAVNPDSATIAAQELKKQLESTDPACATVTVTGSVDLSLVGGAIINSEKTIVGAGASSTIKGSLTIAANAGNTVILGVNFTDGQLAITGAKDIQVSHCTFTNAPVVINGGADNVTFSWNKFTATPANSGSAMTISNAGASTGIMLAGNYFTDSLKSDIPSVTNARIVMCNNYITATGNTSATIAGAGAQILSERNIYQGVNNPLVKHGSGKLRSLDNFTNATTGTLDPGMDTVFVPARSRLMYPAGDTAPFDAAAVAALIQASAGNTNGKNSPTPATTPNATARITATVTGAGSNATATAASVPADGGFTLTATASNFKPAAHQWYLNNFAIRGANTVTYTVADANAGAAYPFSGEGVIRLLPLG